MINVPPHICDRITATYGRYFERLSHLPAQKIGRDVLDEDKVHEQVALFCRMFSLEAADLRGKRLLEIGSGFGIFLAVLRRDYGVESYGIEPSSGGFDSSFDLGREILTHYSIDPAILINAKGEDLPLPNDHFDLIYSCTVLEHTQDPALVLKEALRVLKPGGMMQFVYPNYGSFFDGHYCVPWIPYQPHWLARRWIRLWGRDPTFLDTLQLTNYFKTRHWLRGCPDAEVLSYGEEIFRERMQTLNFKNWAGIGRVRRWLDYFHLFRMIYPATWLLLKVRSFEPIILTVRKRETSKLPVPPDNRAIYAVRWPDWLDMKTFGPSNRWLRSIVEDLVQSLPPTFPLRRVIDIGCGEGSHTALLARKLKGATVLGVDRSKSGIECARARFHEPNLQFEVAESLHDIPSEAHDLVLSLEVLEHVDDWREFTRELARVSSRFVLVSFPTGRMRQFEVNIGHLRNFSHGEFERFAASIGLRPVDVRYAGFPFYSPIFREICNYANSGENKLTIGRYKWWQRRLCDFILLSFRYFSTRHKHGDQFCGLFTKEVA
jgi:ubiquinone/menaquinone biosynthesis C-methylase UbiE